MTASQLLAALLDSGTYRSWDSAPTDVRPAPGYAAELARARAATGLDESVCTGEGLLGGRRVAVAISEFGFLGGSIGVAAAERLTLAVERATAERLPLIAAPASGGTRMQEGTVAFLQMVKITAAVAAHKAAGLSYLVYLRHPTTGGVFASWASVGHVTLAEPGALIGFLGPRVYAALTGAPMPDRVQTAENLLAHGLIDAVVPPDELADYLIRVVAVLAPAPASPFAPPRAPADTSKPPAAPGTASPSGTASGPGTEWPGTAERDSQTSAWESVRISRRRDRPGAGDLIRAAAADIVPLRERGLILALARVGGRPCVLAGQDRTVLPHGPETLRTAQRGMQLAAELRLPFVTVIDTPGGELSPAAEEGGAAREIARCLAALITLPTPTVAILLGQGTGGAALALLPADRVIAAEHAWLAPLAPEGASVIVYKDTAHAAELAARQGIRAADLAAAGLVDHIVAERDPGQLLADLGRLLSAELASLTARDDGARLAARHHRYRQLGTAHSD
jgi:acyl-CoA carboxylase subunit beta